MLRCASQFFHCVECLQAHAKPQERSTRTSDSALKEPRHNILKPNSQPEIVPWRAQAQLHNSPSGSWRIRRNSKYFGKASDLGSKDLRVRREPGTACSSRYTSLRLRSMRAESKLRTKPSPWTWSSCCWVQELTSLIPQGCGKKPAQLKAKSGSPENHMNKRAAAVWLESLEVIKVRSHSLRGEGDRHET